MKKDYKKILIVIIAIISIVVVYKIPRLLINKSNEPLPEVKLRNIKDNKSFAIMIQNENGYEEYTSEDNTWPGSDYVYKEAKCTDNNGALVEGAVSFESTTKTIILETDKTVACTIYFDKSTLGKLRDNENLTNKNNLSSSLQGGMYRYQGIDDVNNWICFGTTDNCGTNDALIDKYMYRIIGITEEGQMYLLKEMFLKEGISITFSWNDKYSVDSSNSNYCDNGKCPEWNTSLLFKRINGTSNGETQGTGAATNKADTDIFVDSSEYDYLKSGDSNGGESPSEWYNLIADHEWMYGDTTNLSSSVLYNGDEMYAIEHGDKETIHYVGTKGNITQETYTWSQKVKAKIGLMYIHDVLYAYTGGNQENVKNSWIHFQKDGYNTSSSNEWLTTRFGVGSITISNTHAMAIRNDGHIGDRALNIELGTRPVFYLESSVKIASGEGTKENPFILDI